MNSAIAVPGGLILKRESARASPESITTLPLPAQLVLPLRQHTGNIATPCVGVGQHVRRGQQIAEADGAISVALHAPADATVRAIEQRPVDDDFALCIVLECALSQTSDAFGPPDHDYHLDEPSEVRQRVASAGIAGLGGAGFPTAVKLSAEVDTRLHTLLLNGAECDPAIGCDDVLMRHQADAILAGARAMLHILQINQCTIAIKADRKAAITSMSTALSELNDDRFVLAPVPARYPQGGERQLIQHLTGQEVPSQGLPIDIGFLCHNVATARAVHHAIELGQPLISRVVSVYGDGVGQPAHLEVPLGTSVADVITFCGGYAGNPDSLVIGGRMMGFGAATDEVPVTKGTNAILVRRSEQRQPSAPCIRCGECATVCPAALLPQQLHWHTSAGQHEPLLALNIYDCIECGCCDLVCPSHIPLTQQFKSAKIQLRTRDLKRQTAQRARRRFEARNLRLARIQRERDERRAARREARKSGTARNASTDTVTAAPAVSRQDEIRAAVERARRARAQRERDDEV